MPNDESMRRLLVFTLVGLAVVCAPGAASAARGPTYLERATIMEAFNKPGRSFASRCVRLAVSTVDPRFAVLRSPRTIPKACLDSGEVGDGYAIFRRATRTSLVWRPVMEGSDPPCGALPAAALRDLFGTTSC